jgi:Spy/CpxP family protein refolding chaperone
MGRQLDLTKDQRQKIRDVFKAERQAKRTERKAKRGERKKRGGMFGQLNPEAFMSADHFDKSAFEKAVQDQAARRKADREAKRQSRLKQRAEFLEKIFNILTPEQRVKWIELSKGK